jgi:hypothetical protein
MKQIQIVSPTVQWGANEINPNSSSKGANKMNQIVAHSSNGANKMNLRGEGSKPATTKASNRKRNEVHQS